MSWNLLDPAVSGRLSLLSCPRKSLLNYPFQGQNRSWVWTVNCKSSARHESPREKGRERDLCLYTAKRYNTHLARMLRFKFLLNSIWYLLFSIGELAKQQTDHREKLAMSADMFSGNELAMGGRGNIEEGFTSKWSFLGLLTCVPGKLGNCQMKAVPWEFFTRDCIFYGHLQLHLHFVISVSLGCVCIVVNFPSAPARNDLPLGCYLWCWRKILSLSLFLF